MILYQFPISHFCEKALWALDHKALAYRTVNLVPGAHVFFIKRLTGATTVPVLRDRGNVVRDSGKIIDYLDEHYPENPLTPADPNLKKEASEWEESFDRGIGRDLRRFFYFHILSDARLAKSLLLQRTPAYGRWIYSCAFPLVRGVMRKSMNIRPEPAERSRKNLTEGLARLNSALEKREYLVGNSFSRADLTAASLLAPLFQPPEHGFQWPSPEAMPRVLTAYQSEFQDSRVGRWVLSMYERHR